MGLSAYIGLPGRSELLAVARGVEKKWIGGRVTGQRQTRHRRRPPFRRGNGGRDGRRLQNQERPPCSGRYRRQDHHALDMLATTAALADHQRSVSLVWPKSSWIFRGSGASYSSASVSAPRNLTPAAAAATFCPCPPGSRLLLPTVLASTGGRLGRWARRV